MATTDRNRRDSMLQTTGALPNGNTTVYTADFDLGAASVGHTELEHLEIEVAIPLLTVGELPNGQTLTCDMMQGPTAAPTTLGGAPSGVVTGAGGAGAVATAFRFKLHPNAGRYIRARFAGSATFGNASAKTGTLSVLA